MKTKSIQFKAEAVREDGFFSGYCNVFDVVDSYGDSVKKGAFVKSLNDWQARGKMPPVLWQHKRDEVIGVWHKLYEDEHGLYGEAQLFVNDIAKAKEAHTLLKHGAIDGLSIGYSLDKWAYDEEKQVYDLLEIDLKEVSVVTMPANESSRIDAVKSTLSQGDLPTLSEFEKFLREAGFSKSQAVTIASHGLRKLLGEPTGSEETLAILKSINGESND